MAGLDRIAELLGEEAGRLLDFAAPKVSRDLMHLPGPDWVDRVLAVTDRPPAVLRNFQALLGHGRLANTGYLSILPVDQDVEHSAGASFAPHPAYFDPENLVRLAIEGGCNAVASTRGTLGSVARRYAHKIPFILKLNHNELLTHPNRYDQTPFASVDQAFDMGAAAVGATVYFGAPESRREIEEVSEAFQAAHELGLVTILWAYLRNPAFKIGKTDYHVSADLTGQANRLAVTIGADIVKQKLPVLTGGYKALNEQGPYGHFSERMYSDLMSDHPIDLCRYQVVNQYLGRIGLINSGGASGKNDLAEAVRTAVINKRAGGMGLITGRKAFQRPMASGVALLNAVQDVYLEKGVTVA